MRLSSALIASAVPASPPRPLPPTAASSSSPTRRTAMASTSASPGARNAAPMPPAPTASHGNLHRPPPIAASIPTKSPARFRAAAATNAPATAAANTSPSPASARGDFSGISRAGLPHLRPGNDVTLPREAGIGCGLGRRMPPWPRDWAFEPRGSALNGRICWKFATLPLSLRILTCAVLLGIAAPGAPALAQTNDDAMAQMNQDGPATAGRAGQSDLHPARRTIGDHRPRRRHRRPRQG